MLSVITPFHRPNADILRQTAESLRRQTHQDFEWVLVPNNDALGWEIPDLLPGRARVVPFEQRTDSIGAIKHFAFTQGRGDTLVELDWDDLLTPTALEEVSAAMRGSDFVYSNAAYFVGDFQKAPRFDPAVGWHWRPFVYDGHELDEIIAFPPDDAGTWLSIHVAPDHLRAWRAEFYRQIGGHNEQMPIADDHELLLRTYLATERIKHIDKCLYLYRAEGNSWRERSKEVQQLTWQNYRHYVEAVALTWAKRRGLMRVDLGGGINPRPGYISVDKYPPADMVADLEKRFPFEDNSVGVVRASDFLEHLPDKLHTMREIHRVLAPGGFLLSHTPSTGGYGADQDPTHVSRWNRNSFWYWTKREQAQFVRRGAEGVRFMTQCLVEDYPSEWHKANNILYVTFEGRALKDGNRPPGRIEI